MIGHGCQNAENYMYVGRSWGTSNRSYIMGSTDQYKFTAFPPPHPPTVNQNHITCLDLIKFHIFCGTLVKVSAWVVFNKVYTRPQAKCAMC